MSEVQKTTNLDTQDVTKKSQAWWEKHEVWPVSKKTTEEIKVAKAKEFWKKYWYKEEKEEQKKSINKPNETKEKVKEKLKTRADVLRWSEKIIWDRINWKLEELWVEKADLSSEKYEKIKGEVMESLDDWDLEEILQEKIANNDENITYEFTWKDWVKKEITESQFNHIQRENPKIKALVAQIDNPEFAKELLAVYSKDELKYFSPILEQLKKDWKTPENLGEFDKILREKLSEAKNKSKQDEWLPADTKSPAQMSSTEMKNIANVVSSSPTDWTKPEKKETANDWLIDRALEQVKDNPVRYALLTKLKADLHINEKNNADKIKEFHKTAWQGNASEKTPWCMSYAYTRASTTSWLQWVWNPTAWARDWVNWWTDATNNPQPWDIVVFARWKWWHIWFYLWTDAGGNPIIIWGNQSNEISIKTDKRPVLAIRSLVPKSIDEKVKNKSEKIS